MRRIFRISSRAWWVSADNPRSAARLVATKNLPCNDCNHVDVKVRGLMMTKHNSRWRCEHLVMAGAISGNEEDQRAT